jgi:hypothetical protein
LTLPTDQVIVRLPSNYGCPDYHDASSFRWGRFAFPLMLPWGLRPGASIGMIALELRGWLRNDFPVSVALMVAVMPPPAPLRQSPEMLFRANARI